MAQAPAQPEPAANLVSAYAPGSKVRVTQKIPFGKGDRTVTIEGVVVRYGQQKTGSWFAHAKDDKLWLDRLELRRDDGEVVVCNLDRYSVVERVG
ncbi:MAG: hypothetical protein ACKVZJ_15185 [Phycisphaerales bacterium]